MTPGHYHGSAGTVQLGQITTGGHLHVQAQVFTANDWTIVVGLKHSALEAPSSGASAVTGVSELTRLAGFRKRSYLLEGFGFQNVDSHRNQSRQRLA
jgi:hypothetical protein